MYHTYILLLYFTLDRFSKVLKKLDITGVKGERRRVPEIQF